MDTANRSVTTASAGPAQPASRLAWWVDARTVPPSRDAVCLQRSQAPRTQHHCRTPFQILQLGAATPCPTPPNSTPPISRSAGLSGQWRNSPQRRLVTEERRRHGGVISAVAHRFAQGHRPFALHAATIEASHRISAATPAHPRHPFHVVALRAGNEVLARICRRCDLDANWVVAVVEPSTPAATTPNTSASA